MKPISIRTTFVWGGIGCFALALVIAGVMAWDGFFRLGKEAQVIEAPGFHVLDLETPGVYAGIYQHRGSGGLPVEAVSRLDIRLTSKDTYQEVPVMMNKSVQVFSKFGVQGLLVCNFLIEKPGFYTLSALYNGDAGPTLPLLLVPQQAGTLGSMLVAGTIFFTIFMGLGLYLIRQSRRL